MSSEYMEPETSNQTAALVRQYALAGREADRDSALAAAALEQLIVLCRPVAQRIVRTYAWREADQDDLVQEALIRLTFRLPQLRDPAAFPQWFGTVVRNVCRAWLRREHARGPLLPLASVPSPATSIRAAVDLADPQVAGAFATAEIFDVLRRFLRTLPPPQRAALTLTYVDGYSHEQVGRALGISPRAVEGLVYRALRRVQAIAAQCTDEPEALSVWCSHCRQPLVAMLEPDSPTHPFRLRLRCPHCTPPGEWLHTGTLSFGRYASLEAAYARGAVECAQLLTRWARAAPAATPSCWRCATPLQHDQHWWTPWWRRGERPVYMITWFCQNCAATSPPLHVQFGPTIASLVPAYRAFRQATPLLEYEPEVVVKEAGEERHRFTATDPLTGRRATVVTSCDTLEVRHFELSLP